MLNGQSQLQRVRDLALSFPSVRTAYEIGDLPSLDGSASGRFEPIQFDREVGDICGGSGCAHALAFVLWVWNPNCKWESGQFNLRYAWDVWDEPHQDAWKAWAANPYWF